MNFINEQFDIYYTLDVPFMENVKFRTKLEALDAAKAHPNATIKFNWFPNLWKTYDYSKEPNKSYDQLKLERAIRLREKYKYLRLYFSGGSDSISMLNTFINNGIYIDEIINMQKSFNKFDKLDPDIENQRSAIPYLKAVEHLIPNTKITIYNLTLEDLVAYNQAMGSGKENRRIIFGNSSEIDFIPDHQILHWKDTRDYVGHIEGGQKPTIFYLNGEWYFGSYDLANAGFYNNAEDFFFDSQEPELYLKTVHMLKNYADNLLKTDYNKFVWIKDKRNDKAVRKELMPIIGRDPVMDDISLIKLHFNQHSAPVLKFNNKKIKYNFIRTFEVIKSVIDQNLIGDELRIWSDNLSQLVDNYGQGIKKDSNKQPHPVIGFNPVLSTIYSLENAGKKSTDHSSIQHKLIVL